MFLHTRLSHKLSLAGARLPPPKPILFPHHSKALSFLVQREGQGDSTQALGRLAEKRAIALPLRVRQSLKGHMRLTEKPAVLRGGFMTLRE